MVNTIHPLFVHFPIAFIIAAGIIAIIDLIKNSSQLKKVLLWFLIFGAIGAFSAAVSGVIDANAIPHNSIIHEIMKVHQAIGITISIVSCLLAIWLLFRISKMNKIENILFVLVLWVVLALVTYNGYLGGKMVYDNGAGIKPMQKTFLLEDHDHDE